MGKLCVKKSSNEIFVEMFRGKATFNGARKGLIRNQRSLHQEDRKYSAWSIFCFKRTSRTNKWKQELNKSTTERGTYVSKIGNKKNMHAILS
jgi:hypothetical protein